MPSLAKASLRTFTALQVPNFRFFVAGQVVSLSGTWMQGVAQSWLVLLLTGSGTALGLVVAAQTLPILFGGMFGGVIADRFSKRNLLIATQAASAAQALLLGTLVATGSVQVWMVAVLAFGLGCINAIDIPTRHAFVFELVGARHVTSAVSLSNVIGHLGLVTGPALAGLLIATVGVAPCFFVNSASYLAVIVALLLMHPDELNSSKKTRQMRGQMSEGFKYAFRSPAIRTPLILLFVAGTFAFEFQVSLPLLARYTFNAGSIGFGALNSFAGIGAIIGGLLTAARAKANARLLGLATFAFGLSLLAVAGAPTFALALILLAFVGAFSVLFTSMAVSSMQLASAPQMRGRVMALYAIAFAGSSPIGGPIVGWVGQTFGARWSLAIGGLATVLVALVSWRSLISLHRAFPLGPAPAVEDLEVAV